MRTSVLTSRLAASAILLAFGAVVTPGATAGAPPSFYKAYDAAPIKLQAHGDPSEPISFRNIWVRKLP